MDSAAPILLVPSEPLVPLEQVSYVIPIPANMYENEECELPERNDPVSETILERACKYNRRVAIRPSRLKELQALEASLPQLLKAAAASVKKEKLQELHARDTPDAVRARAKAYADRNREKINARRRDQRRIKADASKGTLANNTRIIIRKCITIAPSDAE